MAILLTGFAGASAANRTQVQTVPVDPYGVVKVTPTPPASPSIEITGDVSSPPPSSRTAFSTAATCNASNSLSTDAARELISRVAAQEHFDANLLTAVAHTESRLHMDAVSPKGAVGLMQLMPETAARFGVNPCDAAANVLGGIRYLRYLQSRYENPLYVLAAYNAGEDAVDRNRGIPPFPETVSYVAQVLDAAYAWPTPGNEAAAKSEQPSPKAKPSEQTDAWSQGFVLHVTSTEN
ncbi:lytic transglycosylase domain-containing protein [Rhizobium sp. VS19-DR104.2]|uniref:lytic transglycosylase domain-containing protein n=1 Tax=unclassified Rhizobium TaxID=2613769 RepID=UPI001CC68505|nr:MULTISPECIES: lytic transglycosylase domain-containing protein [unclassified Rhizobium]MBZ5762291.1 lytic transglycosylase domain-containing protein [Rhizobium sp. VS19-DR96]MBZ5768307.1 lytic transglycosylase domain-containing protein [Rhizobium sp. VS19-DR129.2]MBZ5775821.1 lytic transglycosylase domain-containing protein [Rhizobium sp. VS19-DRK62.2]MBZ5787158.1 lytic transglycosylase domain-containing protein [Rhizobium sp. VS19-DR121]MBZ5804233.1 lytic transglycosylase domain-containing